MFRKNKNPHYGEQRTKAYFELVVQSIHMPKNEYFLRNSTYSIYLSERSRCRVKSKSRTEALADVDYTVRVNECLRFKATLFQPTTDDESAPYNEKNRTLVVCQKTKMKNGSYLFRDIGYINLALHEIIQDPERVTCNLTVIDPDNNVDAWLDVQIRHSFVKNKNRNLHGAGSWFIGGSQYHGKHESQGIIKHEFNIQPMDSVFDLFQSPNSDKEKSVPNADSLESNASTARSSVTEGYNSDNKHVLRANQFNSGECTVCETETRGNSVSASDWDEDNEEVEENPADNADTDLIEPATATKMKKVDSFGSCIGSVVSYAGSENFDDDHRDQQFMPKTPQKIYNPANSEADLTGMLRGSQIDIEYFELLQERLNEDEKEQLDFGVSMSEMMDLF